MNQVELYLKVRLKEGRLYPDEVAERLPMLPDDHPLAQEWRVRSASCKRLVHYLARLEQPLTILDLGCGNGWLSSQLAYLPGTRVFGIDRNTFELAQAVRLFSRSNLIFLDADIFNAPFMRQFFDVIVIASVIQYFPDLLTLLRALQQLIKPGGEIHLLDSPLYKPEQLQSARQRTRLYYDSLGFPEMAEHYYHHTFNELDEFSPHWLYQSNDLEARLARFVGRAVSPFPWVCLR